MPAMDGRNVPRIGNWNVKLLRHTESEVIWEIECYNLNILGLDETKIRSNSMKVIDRAR